MKQNPPPAQGVRNYWRLFGDQQNAGLQLLASTGGPASAAQRWSGSPGLGAPLASQTAKDCASPCRALHTKPKATLGTTPSKTELNSLRNRGRWTERAGDDAGAASQYL